MLPVYLSDPTGAGRRSPNDQKFITEHLHGTVMNALSAAGVGSVRRAAPDMVPGNASLEGCSALILFGGFDVDASFYTESPRISPYAYIDEYELALIRHAVASNLPVLGICRGMQLLNVAFGGTLHTDIGFMTKATHHDFSAERYGDRFVPHDVMVEKSEALPDGFYTVASAHHQAVKCVGSGLTITGYSPSDGVVEMIEGLDANVVGVQWHPEASQVQQSDTLGMLIANLVAQIPGTPSYNEDVRFVDNPTATPALMGLQLEELLSTST
jgi:putative glutamine amidotransferase